MHGLPEELPTDGREVFTGLVCPECSGNLVVSAHKDHIFVQCRVGHSYGLAELVLAKELALESILWRAVFAYEELAALLGDLNAHGLSDWFGADNCRARCEAAQEQARRLRALIQTDRPLTAHSSGDGEIRTSAS